MRSTPKAGQAYRHFKGRTYTVLSIAHEADLDIEFVIHQGEDGRIWARSMSNFLGFKETDQGLVTRFTEV